MMCQKGVAKSERTERERRAREIGTLRYSTFRRGEKINDRSPHSRAKTPPAPQIIFAHFHPFCAFETSRGNGPSPSGIHVYTTNHPCINLHPPYRLGKSGPEWRKLSSSTHAQRTHPYTLRETHAPRASLRCARATWPLTYKECKRNEARTGASPSLLT